MADRLDARDAYEVFAEFYDAFTRHHDDHGWTGLLERLAHDAGLTGYRLLDVACGTGKSFMPMLARGYDVVACDISPSMAAIAREKAAGRVDVHVHDMRELPKLGEFDLVWCLGDALNYLRDERELHAALASVRRNLAPDGLFVCDLNTLSTFRRLYSSLVVQVDDDAVLLLDGQGSSTLEPGGSAEVWIDRLQQLGEGTWARARSVHHHQHHPVQRVTTACFASGLEPVAAYGTETTGGVESGPDELRHSKVVHIARDRRA